MNKKFLTLILLLFVMQSCVISTAVTRKDENFTGKVQKVYILMRGPNSALEFFNGFNEELKIQLATKGVKMEAEISTH